MRVPGPRLREMLNKLPDISEKLLIAAQERRRLLTETGVLGLRVVGHGKCRDTMLVREFLFKNFVPHPTGRDGVKQRAMGFEPTTSALGRLHSTTELRPHYRPLFYKGL